MVKTAALPEWMRNLDLEKMELYPGATEAALTRLEDTLGIFLPLRYCEFMIATDGFRVPHACDSVELYPIGNGDTEPLTVINRERLTVGRVYTIVRESLHDAPDYPLLVIGDTTDEEGEVGFMLSELRKVRSDTLPVWSPDPNNDRYYWTASSFEEFVADLCKIKPGGAYVSSMDERDTVCWEPEHKSPPSSNTRKWWQFW